MKVTVIVPAFKQEKTIKTDIENICNVMSQTRWEYNLLVVDDGSPDKTLEEAKKIKNPNVKCYGYDTNHGKGYAVRYGMARADGDYIAFIDAGMDIDPNGISMLLEHMEWYNADIIVGSKRHLASQVNYPFIRRVYSWGYHTIVKVLFGLRLKDTQTGLKVCKRQVLEKVLPRLLVKRYAFDIELLSVANRLGFTRIYEAPVKINWDHGNTSFKKFLFVDKQIRMMLLDTAAVFYRLKIKKYYDDSSKRKWVYNKDLEMRINTGEMG